MTDVVAVVSPDAEVRVGEVADERIAVDLVRKGVARIVAEIAVGVVPTAGAVSGEAESGEAESGTSATVPARTCPLPASGR